MCKFNPAVLTTTERTRIPAGITDELWNVLNKMLHDRVFHAVRSDACVIEYGEHLYKRLGHDPSKHDYIRHKMRELGRLLLCSKKHNDLTTIKEHIQPANVTHVVHAVRKMAGYNSEKDTRSCPSLALGIGYSLKKVSLLVESCASAKGDDDAVKEAQTFRSVYEAAWNELMPSASLRTLQESEGKAPLLLAFTKDVQTLHSFLEAQQQELFRELSSVPSLQTHTQLTKVILAQVVLFNRRRAEEVSKIPLSAYASPSVSNPQEDVNVALSDLEKRLFQHFRRLRIKGKDGRKHSVRLTPAMQQTLDLLVSKRHECGIVAENTYLFARPSSLTSYSSSHCLRYFAGVCGAQSPESLASKKLSKQTETLSQVLHLSDTALDQLADFLEHDINVESHFYRLPEGTLQLAKISKLLLALEQGRLAAFKGKSLDDVNIDPEENVHVDSDRDGDCVDSCESDSDQEPDQEPDSPDTANATPAKNRTTPQVTDRGRSRQRPSKERPPLKRKKWSVEEKAAVERHMTSFISGGRVPGKRDCDKCLKMEKKALKSRDWRSIKFYVKNRINAQKNKT